MTVQVASEVQNPFRGCAWLFRRLHELIARGQEDSEEADALRDQMDPLWSAMTPSRAVSLRRPPPLSKYAEVYSQGSGGW